MGYLHERHGIILLKNTPPGTCPECATAHSPEQPHNCRSLCYQYKFYDTHGRWPTWADAMEHCPEEVKRHWQKELEARGISMEGGKYDEKL